MAAQGRYRVRSRGADVRYALRPRRLGGARRLSPCDAGPDRRPWELGLIDEVSIDLVPVLLGSGVPLFEQLKADPILLDGPCLVVEGERVTHLRYTIRGP
jgi:hypothetical protein